ncbi:SseB family protein [Streptomyces sp. NPDC047072]|uniref:SseB family protein n=1 Tax=Streptomyces sp. NPDC047072 TaxID=3154809 RepID=UPI0033C9691B
MKADTGRGPVAGAGVLERATLTAEIHDLYGGRGDGDRLLASFRAAALYVPLEEEEPMCSTEADGVQWLYAFTSTAELERFARARAGDGTDNSPRSGRIAYWTVLGSRLLDTAVPAAVAGTRTPTGVAVDVGGVRPLLLPPVSGIVPDPVAVGLPSREDRT